MIFLLMILGSLLVGFLVIYEIVATHSRGEYLRLENRFIKIDLPRNWFVYSWKTENSTGDIYNVFLTPPDLLSAIIFKIHDEKATQNFMKEYNLTDALSVATFEIERVYNWTQSKNENASIIFKETGEIIPKPSSSLVLGSDSISGSPLGLDIVTSKTIKPTWRLKGASFIVYLLEYFQNLFVLLFYLQKVVQPNSPT